MNTVTRSSLRDLLNRSNSNKQAHIIGRACVALFKRQTESEKSSDQTHNTNNRGFSQADAYAGSKTAKSFLKYGTLQDWQVEQWTRHDRNGYPRICKYWRQLDEVAREKMAGQTVVVTNLLSGQPVTIRKEDHGTCCDPSTERYHCM